MSTLPATLRESYTYLPPLLAPGHPFFPFGLVDVVGAMRLSMIVNWIASGAFDPPSDNSKSSQKKGKGARKPKKARAPLLQELAGLMVVVFGGETFLCGSLAGPVNDLITDARHVHRYASIMAGVAESGSSIHRYPCVTSSYLTIADSRHDSNQDALGVPPPISPKPLPRAHLHGP